MTIATEIGLRYEFAVRAPIDEVFALLADVPRSASHFPKVDRLVDLGGGAYRWEMQKVGTPQIAIRTVYGCAYVSNARRRTVTWTPIDGVGNARISGYWKLAKRKGSGTTIVLDTDGRVEMALPAVMQVVVEPIVRDEFEGLMDRYIANLVEAFGGELD